MARSYRDKAGRRAERMVAAIRDALRQGNGNEALTEACASLRSEMAKIRTRRPHDAALIDAQLAGMIAGITDLLPTYRPLPGSDPLGTFTAALQRQYDGEFSGEASHA